MHRSGPSRLRAACVLAIACAMSAAHAQQVVSVVEDAPLKVIRPFPSDALRGSLVVGTPPEVLLNGQPARLAPGARIRGANNMLVMSAGMSGKKYLVNYTVDTSGLIKDVWVLRPVEAAVQPWPTTVEQAKSWQFNPATQMWIKP